jgi:hypothetical protein
MLNNEIIENDVNGISCELLVHQDSITFISFTKLYVFREFYCLLSSFFT